MRLTIRPASELRNRVFTSSDVVTGLVYLDIHKSLSISEIKFSIKGKRMEAHEKVSDKTDPPSYSTTEIQRDC